MAGLGGDSVQSFKMAPLVNVLAGGGKWLRHLQVNGLFACSKAPGWWLARYLLAGNSPQANPPPPFTSRCV
jgi:hypothetical protein